VFDERQDVARFFTSGLKTAIGFLAQDHGHGLPAPRQPDRLARSISCTRAVNAFLASVIGTSCKDFCIALLPGHLAG
jgi:hypothetical protein